MSSINRSSVLMPDAVHAMEKNLKGILALAGVPLARLNARVDTHSGTASINHYKDSDGKLYATVLFPALPSTYRLTRDEFDRWTGYFLHEICHALYTDAVVWSQACRESLHELVNGMEDVRIERVMIDSARVDNAAARLTELLQWVAGREPPQGVKAYNPNDLANLPWTLAPIGR